MTPRTAALLLLLCGPSTVSAGDGVIEINQASIGAAGGFPFHITESGSYRLTGNLNGSLGVAAIVIDVNDVTLDLNGFQLDGFGNGTAGITVSGAVGNVVVRNGTVTGFEMGVALLSAGDAYVERIRAHHNVDSGAIQVGPLGSVVDSLASANDGTGIRALVLGRVEGSIAGFNTVNGVSASGLVTGNITSDNGSDGILGGVSGYWETLLQGNVATSNSDDGIETLGPTFLLECSMRTNGASGIDAVPDGTPSPWYSYARNVVSSDGGAVITAFGVDGNVCNGHLYCP